nr:hypothetical protein Iba_chr09eCG10870 [Ipomoea batatas]
MEQLPGRFVSWRSINRREIRTGTDPHHHHGRRLAGRICLATLTAPLEGWRSRLRLRLLLTRLPNAFSYTKPEMTVERSAWKGPDSVETGVMKG